jgi:hypothetical protein
MEKLILLLNASTAIGFWGLMLQATPIAGQFMPLATTAVDSAKNRAIPINAELVKRQNTACPENTYHCPASLGSAFSGICCLIGEECAFDVNNKPACCPAGYLPPAPTLNCFDGDHKKLTRWQ